jgi:hypothetical protein
MVGAREFLKVGASFRMPLCVWLRSYEGRLPFAFLQVGCVVFSFPGGVSCGLRSGVREQGGWFSGGDVVAVLSHTVLGS